MTETSLWGRGREGGGGAGGGRRSKGPESGGEKWPGRRGPRRGCSPRPGRASRSAGRRTCLLGARGPSGPARARPSGSALPSRGDETRRKLTSRLSQKWVSSCWERNVFSKSWGSGLHAHAEEGVSEEIHGVRNL